MSNQLLAIVGLVISAATVAVCAVALYTRRESGLAMWRGWRTAEGEAWRRRYALRRQTAKQERRRRRNIKKEAKRLMKQIVANLTRQGLARVQEKRGAVTFYAKIRIEAVIMTDDAIYYKVDNRTPFGITFTDLARPEVAENLSAAIQRETRIDLSTDYGCWVIVGLRSGVASIPRLFPWKSEHTERNATELLPKTKRYAIPIGVAENYKYVWADVRDLIHVLVAGTTGGGKSMFMNQALLTMIDRTPPNLLKLALVDLKGGLEFMPYENIPHLLAPICYERAGVADMLKMFRREKERRFILLREKKLKDIKAWNATQRLKMPVWVLVFDEIQNLILDSKIKAEVEDLLADLAFQGRAVGLSVWLCTQFPEKKVISTAIRANTPTKICFSTTQTGSMLVLDDTAASKLPLGGRAIFRQAGSENILVQTPYLGGLRDDKTIDKKSEQTMILNEIKAATAKWTKTEESEDVGAYTLFRKLLDDYMGKASLRVAVDAGVMSEAKIRKIFLKWDYNFKEEGPLIQIGSSYYILGMVPQSGGLCRWVVPIDSPPSSPDEVEMIFKRWISGADSAEDEGVEVESMYEVDETEEDKTHVKETSKSADVETPSADSAEARPEVGGASFLARNQIINSLTSVSEKNHEEALV